MNLKPPSQPVSSQLNRLGLAFAMIPLGVMLLLLPTTIQSGSFALFVASLTCGVLFVLADLLAGMLDEGLWAGYLYFTVVVAWMVLGLGITLLIIVIGVLLAAFGRWQQKQVTFRAITELVMARITMNGIAILCVDLLYSAAGQSTPVTALSPDNLIILTPALVAGLLATKLLATFLLGRFTLISRNNSMMLELLLLTVAPVMAVVFSTIGLISFVVLMGVMGVQAIRYRQIHTTQQSLIRRVEQLSALDSVGRELTSSIGIEDVLMTIYQRISKIVDVSTYYIALYDARHETLEFPLVIEHGARITWPELPLQNIPLTGYVVSNAKLLHINQETKNDYQQQGLPLPEPHLAFAGFPLIAGDKVLGALCITSHHNPEFTPDEISTVQTIAHQAGLTIRNAVLYNRSVKTNENLAIINEFTQSVVFNMDTQAVLESACQTTIRVANADRAAIFLPQPEQRHRFQLACGLHLTPEYQAAVEQWPYDLTRYANGPFVVTDVEENPTLKALGQLGKFKSTAEIPMRSGSAIVGILVAYHNKPYFYRKTDLGLLETLANQITAAVDNTELLKTLEAYASEQAQLVYLSRISTSHLELSMVISSVSSLIRTIMEAERVYIGLLDTSKENIGFYGMNGERKNYPAHNIPEIQASHPTPVIFQRATASEGLANVMDECGDTSIALASLVANNHYLGVVALGTPAKFGDNETRLLELATNQVAAQIHNAQQFGYVEDALNRRLKQLSLIEDIARQISSALNVEQLIGNVLEAAIRVTQADMAGLALLSSDNMFQIIGKEYIDGQWEMRQINRPSNQGVMGRVAKTGQPEIIADNFNTADYISTFSPGRYRSSLVVPLLKEKTVLGVLDIESTQADFFVEEHLDFILSLAGHAVISIQNARLLQERQKQIDTLTGLRELSLRLSSVTDRRSVGNVILQTALDMTEGETGYLFEYHEDGLDIPLLSMASRLPNFVIEPSMPQKLLERAAKQGEIQIVVDIHEHPDFRDYPFLDDLQYLSLIVAPIKHGSQVEELLCILFTRPRPNLDNHLGSLELLAIQAAGHLENTKLYGKILTGNNRMRAILDASSDGIILLDRNARLIESNISAEHILGIDLEDAIGENFLELLLHQMETEDSTNVMIEGMKNMARMLRLEPERITRRQYEFKKYDFSMYIEEIGSPVMDNSGQIMGRLIVLRDITEARQLEIYREEITNMVVHDLRGPLAGIISGLNMADEVTEMDLKSLPAYDVLKPVLDVSVNNAQGLLELVNTILDIAKRESADWTLNTDAISIEDLITGALVMVQPLVQEAKLTVEQHFQQHLPLVGADRTEIRRVLFNLLDNAIRYSPPGGKIWVGTELVENGNKVLVRVANTGKPIPAEERERIFEKFRQVPGNIPVNGRKGSGLGLNFCKLVIDAHGGKIWVESEGPLNGASFVFTLPVVIEPVNGAPLP